MAQVNVALGERSYRIEIRSGLMASLGKLVKETLPNARRALIITDTNVGPLFSGQAQAALEQAGLAVTTVTIPAGERSKTLTEAYKLYSACVGAGLERSSFIMALGGGVIGDLAGFVAATYLRGIAVVQVPTTLLSQVDSSVGGKTGVDLAEGKNLVGAFHQPSLVVADLDTLGHLPRRELSAGLAEVVKHSIIRDAQFMGYLEGSADQILALDQGVMSYVVESNCRIKAGVVGQDEREGGLRAILNFGHTVGHAVEATMGFRGWLHGECVAVGMCAATAIARETGVLQDPELQGRLERLLQRFGLPVSLPPQMTLATLAPLMQRDKKVEAGKIHWVLPVRVGEVIVTPDVPQEAIVRALESVRG